MGAVNIKDINDLSPVEALKVYVEELRLSALPLVGNVVPVAFKDFVKRLPSKEELEYFSEKYRDCDGVSLITGYRGLLAFDIDGEEKWKKFCSIFKKVFGKEPTKLTWVESRKDPRDGSMHYHIYIFYKDFEHSCPANGTRNVGDITLVYNHWIRSTPTLHEGTRYKWIHDDSVAEPLEVKKKDFLRFIEHFDPYFTFDEKELEFDEEGILVKPEDLTKDLTDEQIEKIIECVSKVYPTPGNGRGFFILGLTGLLTILGVKKESVRKLVDKIIEEVDPAKDKNFRAEIDSTYKRVEAGRVISYRHWFRNLGWREEEIDNFRNEIISILRPKPREFFEREFSYVVDIKFETRTVKDKETGETVVYPVQRRKVIKPSKSGFIYLYTYDLIFEEKDGKYEVLARTIRSIESITADKIVINKVVFIGKDIYLNLSIRGFNFEGSLNSVIERLTEIGIVRKKYQNELKMFFEWIATNVEKDKVFEVPGIFVNSRKFVPAIPGKVEVYPTNPYAQLIARKIMQSSELLNYDDYRMFLKQIVTYRNFLPPDVYYVTMGFMTISPFLDSLLTIFHLKPFLILVGGKGSGKSSLGRFITKSAFGSDELKQDVFSSSFREGIVLSSTTFPIFIDDVDKWSAQSFEKLRSTLTGRVRVIRGKPSGDVVFFDERASFVLTANYNILDDVGDPALRDRAIVVELQRKIPIEKKVEFRKSIRCLDETCFAHFFVPDLVFVANECGGFTYFEEAFEKYLNEAYENGIVDGRDPEKFAIVMCGLELLDKVLRMNNFNGIDLDEAKKILVQFFRNGSVEAYPEDLVNVVIALREILESSEDVRDSLFIDYVMDENDKEIVVTTVTLSKLKQRYQNMKIPRNLKSLEEIIKNCFEDLRDRKLLTKRMINGKQYRVCVIPKEVIDVILGAETEGDLEQDESKESTENEAIIDNFTIESIFGYDISLEKQLEELGLKSNAEKEEEKQKESKEVEISEKEESKLTKPPERPRKVWRDEDEMIDISEYAKEVFTNLKKITFNSEEEFERFLKSELENIRGGDSIDS